MHQAARAAVFVGADPAPLRDSARFHKATPEALRAAVTNFEELCAALWPTQHQHHLHGEGCPQEATAAVVPTQSPPARLSSSSGAAGAQPQQQAAVPATTPTLLRQWCAGVDKRAAGWTAVGNAECTERVSRMKVRATIYVRTINGTLLFKHVHKASVCA